MIDDTLLDTAAKSWNVDPKLLKTVYQIESSLGKDPSTSPKGAVGDFQIMPKTFEGLGGTDITDPAQQVFAAAKYIREGLDKTGNSEDALRYYNAGPDRTHWNNPETNGYIQKARAYYPTQVLNITPGPQPATGPQPPLVASNNIPPTANDASPSDIPPGLQEILKTGTSPGQAPAAPPPEDVPSGLQEILKTGTSSTPEQPTPGQPPSDTSWLGAIKYGAATPFSQMGQTATAMGYPETGKSLDVTPGGYDPASPKVGLSLEGLSYLPRAALEQGGEIIGTWLSRAAGALVGGAIGGPGGAIVGGVSAPALFQAAQVVGPIAVARAKNDGRDHPSPDDWMAAITTASGQGLLNSIFTPGKAASGLLVNAAKEATNITGQNLLQQTGETSGTNKGTTIDSDKIVNNLLIGAGAGAAAHGVIKTGETIKGSEPIEPVYPTKTSSTRPDAAKTEDVVKEYVKPTIPDRVQERVLSTPEAKAHNARSKIEEVQLSNPPTGPDSNQYVEGSVPTLAETTGDQSHANEQRLLLTDPGPAGDQMRSRINSNNQARNKALSEVVGDPHAIDQLQAEGDEYRRGLVNDVDKGKYFIQAIDAQPIYNHIQDILNDPHASEQHQVKPELKELQDRLRDESDELKDDPRSILGIRDDLVSRLPSIPPSVRPHIRSVIKSMDVQLHEALPDENRFQSIVDHDNITRSRIDALKYLQQMNIQDSSGNISYPKFQAFMTRLVDDRINREPGATHIPDSTMDALWDIRDDLARSHNINHKIGQVDIEQPQHSIFRRIGPQVVGGGIGETIGHGLAGPGGQWVGGLMGDIAGAMIGNKLSSYNKGIKLNKKAKTHLKKAGGNLLSPP
jgi:hypothetical protein